jgi:type I restriction enzyme S subunit
MSNLNQKLLLKMPIALPPNKEQKRIVAKVDELFSLCDQLAAQLATAQTARERALTALLAQAA